MPNILTHYEFYKQIGGTKKAGFLGSQGPDPFFYAGFTKNKIIVQFGEDLHHVDPVRTFTFLLDYLKNNNDKEKEALKDYVYGLLAHYCLDVTCHPFVWWFGGFRIKESDKKGIEYNHAFMESCLDVLVLDHYHDKQKCYKALDHKNKELRAISKMLYHLGKDEFKLNEIKENTYYKNVKQMRFAQHVIYNKNGKRKKFIDKHIGGQIAAMCEYHDKSLIRYDFANLAKKEYRSSIDNQVLGNSTFFELMEQAKTKYQNDEKLFDKYLKNEIKKEDLSVISNNFHHDGFKVGTIKKYHGCIIN